MAMAEDAASVLEEFVQNGKVSEKKVVLIQSWRPPSSRQPTRRDHPLDGGNPGQRPSGSRLPHRCQRPW